ncbi:MAG: hypothetical protein JW772_03995 [Candidatus Diapherotrites archaeon]|nr:hypothetical protein [Candidatus Diapherotrites archaeon]
MKVTKIFGIVLVIIALLWIGNNFLHGRSCVVGTSLCGFDLGQFLLRSVIPVILIIVALIVASRGKK